MIKFISHPTMRTLQMWREQVIHIQRTMEVVSFMYGEEIITEEVENILLEFNIESDNMTHVELIFGEMFTFIHPENIDFWGPGGHHGFITRLCISQRNKIMKMVDGSFLEFDEHGEAISPVTTFSKAQLEADKKTLMAHVMVELGIFKSVGDAKRNGWDKPIELGDFCVTKRKIKFVITE